MADDPRCPAAVLDAAMATPAARRLVTFMARARGEDETACTRWMRADLSTVLVSAVEAWSALPVIDLRPSGADARR